MKMNKRTFAYLGMILATAIWGLNFVVVKLVVSQYPLIPFLFLRFLIGGVALFAIAMSHPKWREGWRSAPKGKLFVLSVVVAGGYISSALGIEFGASPGVAAMISALVMVATPSLDWLISGHRPNIKFIVALGLSVGAVILVAAQGEASGGGNGVLGVGLELVSVVAFSIQILMIERMAKSVDLLALASGQLVALTLVFGAATVVTATWVTPTPTLWMLLAFSGLGASAIGLMLQVLAQTHVEGAAIAALTSLEPGYAMGFAWLLTRAALPSIYVLALAMLVCASLMETALGRMAIDAGWKAVSDFADMPAVYRYVHRARWPLAED